MSKKAPCGRWKFGCPRRSAECHASCKAYAKWSAEREEFREKRAKEYDKYSTPHRSPEHQRMRMGIKTIR